MIKGRARGTGARRARLAIVVWAVLAGGVAAEDRRDLFRVRAARDGSFWSVGERGAVRMLDASGAPGEAVSTPEGDGWNDVCFATPASGWVVGLDGRVLETGDGGETWTLEVTKGEQHLFAVGCGAGPLGIAVGDWGSIWVRDGAGAWEDRALGEDVVLYGAAVASDGIVVVGEGGAILRSKDRGRTFARIESPARRSLFDVAVGRSGRGVAVGLEGVILRTEDGGLHWEEVPSPVRESLYGVALDGVLGFAVGDLGVALRTDDGGASWRIAAPRLEHPLEFLHGVALHEGRGLAVGASGAILWLR